MYFQNLKKIAVYTVIYGNYDTLKLPKHKSLKDQADFYCFTNLELDSDFYKIVKINFDYGDQIKNSRYPKINPHLFLSEYEVSIYIDANLVLITDDLQALVSKYLASADLAKYRHNQRDCIYQEAAMCIKFNLDQPEVIQKQISRYRQEGFPAHFGLGTNCFIIRRHNKPNIIEFAEKWWQEVLHESRRDQLSFDYIRWKLKTPIEYIPGVWCFSTVNYRTGHTNVTNRVYQEKSVTKIIKSKLLKIAATVLPQRIKIAIKTFFDKTFRELKRIKDLPPLTAGQTTLLGPTFFFTDNTSFLSQFEEIYNTSLLEFSCFSHNPLILDLDANVGMSIAYFKQKYPQARMLAFEPDPILFQTLQLNLKSFHWKKTELHNKALWKEAKEIPFTTISKAKGSYLTKDKIIEVNALRLSQILKEQKVTFLKLKIRGTKTEVIDEAKNELSNVQNIFIEYHSVAGQPQFLGKLLCTLEESGFRVFISSPKTINEYPFIFYNTNQGLDMVLNIRGIRAEVI